MLAAEPGTHHPLGEIGELKSVFEVFCGGIHASTLTDTHCAAPAALPTTASPPPNPPPSVETRGTLRNASAL
jgi:hypothetical protein